jgi:pSer/pThr/pTyr-binding forkhead associated (FHA) protein
MVGQLLVGPLKPVHQRVIFGRAPACDVVAEHLSISRQHAQLMVDHSGSVLLMDLGSAHGTKLQDAWLKPQQQRSVAVGGVFSLGASTRTYKLLEVQKL